MKTNSTPHNENCQTAIEGEGKPGVSNRLTRLRAKQSGQALVFIALAMVVIVAMVGLAIDGGAMYNDRRSAQNGTDASAMAGTRLMLVYTEYMIDNTSSDDDSWHPAGITTAQLENQGNSTYEGLRHAIDTYAARNGLDTTTVTAYFVNDSKQVVTVNNGVAHNCGIGVGRRPCQVGENGVIPWQEGAKGIMVTGSVKSSTFFMGVLGWNQISAAANSTAFMGVAINSGYDTKLLPVGFFTDTTNADSLVQGRTYTLIAKANGIASGIWGWLDYNNYGSNASVLKAWEDCGFNPSVTTASWGTWCPADRNTNNGEGPLVYWVGWPNPDTGTFPNGHQGLTVRFGAGLDGWWLHANTGDVNSGCANLQAANGQLYIVPMFDSQVGGGSNTYFHLYRLAQFLIETGTIQCNKDFEVDGIYEQEFMPGSSGWHGDIRHNSLHLIFMSP